MTRNYWYDISETGCYTEFKSQRDVISHLCGLNENDIKDIVGCKVYRQYSNSETVGVYEIRLNRKGYCKLVKL